MKAARKDKPIRTTPKGAWEGGVINLEKDIPQKRHFNDLTTDAQGNGYPAADAGGKPESD